MKHTKGPWKIIESDDFSCGSRVVFRQIAATRNGTDFQLCLNSVHEPGREKEARERAADARLIAAAPELYFVAGMVADISDAKMDALTHDQLKNLITDMRNEARTAIAKAEGK